MSQIVHLTFRPGEQITLEAIGRARRDLVHDRVTPCGDRWSSDGEYFVMQVHPEHEPVLRNMQLSGFLAFRPAIRGLGIAPVLPDEIGSILGFRVVARW